MVRNSEGVVLVAVAQPLVGVLGAEMADFAAVNFEVGIWSS